MKIQITAEILLDKFRETLVEIDPITGEYEDHSILDLVEQECNWLVDSYIFTTNVEEIQENTSITITWNIDEVKQAVSDRYDACISNEDAFKVLKFLENNTKEITYQLMDEAISAMLRDRLIILINCEEE